MGGNVARVIGDLAEARDGHWPSRAPFPDEDARRRTGVTRRGWRERQRLRPEETM